MSVCTDATGNIYAGGVFTNNSGNYYVAKWDGTTWSEVGGLNALAANGALATVWSDNSGIIYTGGNMINSSGKYYVAQYLGNVGINETIQYDLFSMFPNPAQSVINVKADKELIGAVYTIYDKAGRVIQTGKLNAENTKIELDNLSRGIYMFSVGENMIQTFKVMKE